jgi:hypothetical protein
MKTCYGLLLVLLMQLCSVVHAQTACPPGTIPYGAGNDPSVCGPDTSQQQQAQPQQPGSAPRDKALWGDPNMAPPPDGKWAAVVSDRDKPLLISINKGFSTRKAAVEAAMEDCRSKGGTRCYLISVVKNG